MPFPALPPVPGHGSTRIRRPVLSVVLGVILLGASLIAPPVPGADAAEVRSITLPIHRDSIDDVYWRDTWGAPRGGGRSHIGVDMMGPKMVPLVAARSGRITWGRFDNARGSILRFRDDEGWEYQYIHLNNDSPGTDDASAACDETFSARLCGAISNGRLRPGTPVTAGEVIGYLGDGGNAEHTSPHLHFEIYKPTGDGVTPINPAPSVDAARVRAIEAPEAPASAPDPALPGERGFVDHLWYQIDGRLPTEAERAEFSSAVADVGLWPAMADRVDDASTAAVIDRLYLAFFQRYPDADGIHYWIKIRGSGHAAEDIAEWFAESAEFQERYAGTDFDGFLDGLYQDVLGREPDGSGKEYWLDLLEQGEVNRGTIVVYFTEGDELRALSGHRNEIVALSLVRDGSTPSDAEVDEWSELRSSAAIDTAIENWFSS